MEKFPDRYSSQQAIADKFKIAQPHVARLIEHYTFLERIREKLPTNIIPRGRMLPERLTREVRRAPEYAHPEIIAGIVRTMEAYDRGLYEYPPSVRDIALYVDSFIPRWTQEGTEKKHKSAGKALKPEASGSAPPSDIEELGEATAVELQDLITKRREEAKKRREEAKTKGALGKTTITEEERRAIALYRYYPTDFMREVERFCGDDASIEQVEEFARTVVEVLWDRLKAEEKMEVLRKTQLQLIQMEKD